jgi:hypothetical protein
LVEFVGVVDDALGALMSGQRALGVVAMTRETEVDAGSCA